LTFLITSTYIVDPYYTTESSQLKVFQIGERADRSLPRVSVRVAAFDLLLPYGLSYLTRNLCLFNIAVKIRLMRISMERSNRAGRLEGGEKPRS